jgi:hypothetical protein
MGFPTLILLAIIALALAVVMSGLFTSERSIVGALFSLAVAVVAFGGALYAWGESHSIPWTVGYGTVVLLSMASAARQLVGRGSGNDGDN